MAGGVVVPDQIVGEIPNRREAHASRSEDAKQHAARLSPPPQNRFGHAMDLGIELFDFTERISDLDSQLMKLGTSC